MTTEEWEEKVLDTFEPEKCTRCGGRARIPIHEGARDLNYLFCPKCQRLQKRS